MFNINLRSVDKSKETAKCSADIYIPYWPLWQPLLFLKETLKKEDLFNNYHSVSADFKDLPSSLDVKDDLLHHSEINDIEIGIRQRGLHTDKPRKKTKII